MSATRDFSEQAGAPAATVPSEQTEALAGVAAAATLSAGIGVFVLGLVTTLAAMVPALANILTFYVPAGPLSGKTTVAVAAWLISWLVLHGLWHGVPVPYARVLRWTLVLIAAGLVLSFPPVYEAVAAR